MSDTCEHGNSLRYGCLICIFHEDNEKKIEKLKDELIKLIVSENKKLEDDIIKLQQSREATSRSHKDIFERLEILENSPFGKSTTYAPLFERLTQLSERIDRIDHKCVESLNEHGKRLDEIEKQGYPCQLAEVEEKVFVELEILKDFNSETQKGFNRLSERIDCLINRINRVEVIADEVSEKCKNDLSSWNLLDDKIINLEDKIATKLEILKDFNTETQKGFDRLILRMDCLVNRINELEVESIKPEKSVLVCPGCNGKGFHLCITSNHCYERHPCKACNETGIFHQ